MTDPAERLRYILGETGLGEHKLLDAALAAAEKKGYLDGYNDGHLATVERIRASVLFMRNRIGQPPEKVRIVDLLAILDAERDR